MKVCTDACLFGAWVAKDPLLQTAKSILDIGTGTGLLSLMLAQATQIANSPAIITALEIEDWAAKQATENFSISPWNMRLNLSHQSLQSFTQTNIGLSKKLEFDIIICNPPFFEEDLTSPNVSKNLAAHSIALPWVTLCRNIATLLKEGAVYFCIVPALRAFTMQKYATLNGLQLIEEITVYHSEKKMPFRIFQKYCKTESASTIIRSKLYIKNGNNLYTETFKKLLSPYYLHL